VKAAGKSNVEAILRACRLISRMNRGNPNIHKSQIMYYDMLTKYFSRLLNARENGDFVAAHNVLFLAEIIYAMDFVPFLTETITWMTALFTGECSVILSAGASLGLASEICTPHRGLAGAFSTGALPHPNVMLWSNMVCDNTAKSGELIMELCNCPGFFIDRPFKNSEREVAYLVSELVDRGKVLE